MSAENQRRGSIPREDSEPRCWRHRGSRWPLDPPRAESAFPRQARWDPGETTPGFYAKPRRSGKSGHLSIDAQTALFVGANLAIVVETWWILVLEPTFWLPVLWGGAGLVGAATWDWIKSRSW